MVPRHHRADQPADRVTEPHLNPQINLLKPGSKPFSTESSPCVVRKDQRYPPAAAVSGSSGPVMACRYLAFFWAHLRLPPLPQPRDDFLLLGPEQRIGGQQHPDRHRHVFGIGVGSRCHRATVGSEPVPPARPRGQHLAARARRPFRERVVLSGAGCDGAAQSVNGAVGWDVSSLTWRGTRAVSPVRAAAMVSCWLRPSERIRGRVRGMSLAEHSTPSPAPHNSCCRDRTPHRDAGSTTMCRSAPERGCPG